LQLTPLESLSNSIQLFYRKLPLVLSLSLGKTAKDNIDPNKISAQMQQLAAVIY
jgi:hypothetical protein